MKITKIAQAGREKKLKIVFDFESGEATIAWEDNQFGKEGAPCSDLLNALTSGLAAESKEMSNAGYSDKDTSGIAPEEELGDFGEFAIRQDDDDYDQQRTEQQY